MFHVVLVNALFSLVFPLGKAAMHYAPPFFIVGIRMLIAGLLFLAYYFFFGKKKFDIQKGLWGYLFALSVINIYLANAFEFWGLQYMSSSKTAFIYNLSPFFSALFAFLHFDERMSNKKWLGLFISTLGFIPIFMWNSPEENELCRFGIISSAELALLIATIATVYGWIIMQYLVRTKKSDPIVCNGISMMGGGLISLINSIGVESWDPSPVTQWPAFGGLLSIIIICSVLSFAFYAHLLKKFSATFLSFSGLMGPLFAAFFDWIMFDATVPMSFFFSNLLVFIGIYLFYQEEITLSDMAM